MNAEPSTIYELLTNPARQDWLGIDAQFDPRPRGIYKVSVAGGHPALGEFIEVVQDQKVIFTFGWAEPGHPIPPGTTQVAITLIPEGGETRVRLVHSGLPEDAITDHIGGWTQLLGRLETAATGGVLTPQ